MWVIIGAVGTLLLVVLYYLFNSGPKEAAPDFAGGGEITMSSGGDLGAGDSKMEEDDGTKPVITFYFGSQTGTAEGFAKTLSHEARRAGFKPVIVDLEDFDAAEFVDAAADGAMVCFLMATYGEGEPTDNAAEFYEWLRDKEGELEEGALAGMRFTVFGLGNRQYEHYNKMGRVTAKRFKALGAEEVFPSGEGDDDGTLDEDFAAWKEDMWTTLAQAAGIDGASAGASASAGGAQPLDELEWHVEWMAQQPSDEVVARAKQSVLPADVKLSSRYYYTSVPAKVVVNRELRTGGDGSTRHLELDIRGTSLTYTSADNLGICAENDPQAVESLARWMGYDLDRWFVLSRTNTDSGRTAKPMFPTPCTVRDALARYCDFNGNVRKDFLAQLVNFASDEGQRERMLRMTTKEGKDEFKEFFVQPKRTLYEVFEAFPSCRVPFERLIQMLPRLQPRLYTICSSNMVHPNRVHVVVSVVREAREGNPRMFHGVCSNYMARCQPPPTDNGRRTDGDESKQGPGRSPWPSMLVHVRPSTFTLPENAALPVVMVGPGTGVAPMRAFLQERRHLREQGKTVGETVLFFGCRRREEDFIYQEEFLEYTRDGTLTQLPLAFSRENPMKKEYVQNKMAEHKDLVWRLIHDQGGYFYVCGGTHMGNDVQHALVSIAAEGLGSEQGGEDYVKQMHSDGRYIAELWS